MSALRRIADDPRLGALAVLLIAMAVYLPRLGADGLAGTEGHRVIPGWELLDRLEGAGGGAGGAGAGGTGVSPVRAGGSADGVSLTAPTMFDRLYLRKPPGMMWAEAASAAVFGRTEWAARFVGAASSIALAMVCWGFAWRWFGARAGLAAGVALALTPWLWQSGRSAEIEPLHNLWVALAAFCAIDLLMDGPSLRGGRRGIPPNWIAPRRAGLAPMLAAAGLTLAVAGAAAAKGPAGAPVLGAAILGAALVAMRTGGAGLLRQGAILLLSLAAAAAVIAPVCLAMQRAGEAPGADPVAQGAAEFLWSGPVLEILTLPVAALVAALPLTLALPQAWAAPGGASGGPPGGPPLRGGSVSAGPKGPAPVATGQPAEPAQPVESAPGAATPQRGTRDVAHAPVARALGWATVIAIAAYTLIGVSNVRYVMPAAPLMAPLVGWAVANGIAARGGTGRSLSLVFDRLITRWWWAWAGALLIGSQVYIWRIEPSRDGRSGREAGLTLGAALPPGAEVWANDLVEAVPETLLYAQRAGEGVQVRWRDVAPEEVPAGVFVVLRSDADSGEADAWRAAGELPAPVFEGAVRHYRFLVIEAP